MAKAFLKDQKLNDQNTEIAENIEGNEEESIDK